MTGKHPLRCETCNHKTTISSDSGMCGCLKLKRNITWQQWCIIRDSGCAGHSDVRSADDVLNELDKIKDRISKLNDDGIRIIYTLTLEAELEQLRKGGEG